MVAPGGADEEPDCLGSNADFATYYLGDVWPQFPSSVNVSFKCVNRCKSPTLELCLAHSKHCINVKFYYPKYFTGQTGYQYYP